MKRKAFIFAFAFFVAVQSYAQRKISPGIRAGVNVATLSNIDADFKTDFYAGGILSLNLGRRYTLQPELIYTRQGANNVTFIDYDAITLRRTATARGSGPCTCVRSAVAHGGPR